MQKEGEMKSMVMSDIHFGLKECNLDLHNADESVIKAKRKAKIDYFFNWLITEQKDIDEVIFIGDLFDLHMTSFAKAVLGSYYFLKELANLKGLRKITYIPGNHDHTMWLLHIFYADIIKKFEKDLYPIFDYDFNFVYKRPFCKPDSGSFLQGIFTDKKDIEFCTTYPFKNEPIAGKEYIFFHGHFLDKKQRITQKLFKIFLKDLDLSQLQEFELFCAPQYETFFLLAQCAAGRIGLAHKYNQVKKYLGDYRKPVFRLHRRIREHLHETKLTIKQNPAARELDYVIFGHTHYSGISTHRFRGNPKLIGMNTGSWVNTNNIIGEFIIIDKNMSPDRHPQLYIYEWSQPTPMLHSESEKLNAGIIPKRKVWD